jgi:hypothetical protein
MRESSKQQARRRGKVTASLLPIIPMPKARKQILPPGPISMKF